MDEQVCQPCFRQRRRYEVSSSIVLRQTENGTDCDFGEAQPMTFEKI